MAAESARVQALEAVAHTLSTGGRAHAAGSSVRCRLRGAPTEGVWLTDFTG